MKVNGRIVFYNFKKVQGWRYYAVRLLSWSRHTHAHIEFDLSIPFAFVVVDRRPVKVMRLSALKLLNITKYYEFDLGSFDIDEEDIIFAYRYKPLNSYMMLAYTTLGQFMGMKKPTNCITFICDYLQFKGWDIPNLFTPKQLWESLHDNNNDRWTGKSREDNTSKVDQ